MARVKDLRVKLIAPSLWHSQLTAAEDGLEGEARRFLRSALSAMHNRHVGITVELAFQLVESCLRPAASPTGPWGAVAARLRKSPPSRIGSKADSPDSRLPTSGSRTAILFNASPAYVVFRVALPLVERACRDIGVSYVFCEDDAVRPPIAPPYSQYRRRLSERLEELAGEEDPEMELFWAEAAFTLASLSARPAPLRAAAAQLAQVDPAALACLVRLAPELPEPRPPLERRPRPARRVEQYRPSRNRREGGVEGVHITRRAEEIDSMLISEYANPPAVLAERVLNAGYLALHRPPRSDRARDVLAAGFMPAQVRRRPSGDFVKACWFVAMSRLGFLLWQSGLEASEFRWTEGDERGGARTCSFLLDGMPDPPERDPLEEAAFRGAFLRALDWLPAFLDTRDAFRRLPEIGPEDLRRQDAATLTRWASAAWKRQQEHPAWRTASPSAGDPRDPVRRGLPAEDFSAVHFMLCLPSELYPASRQDASASLGRLHASLGLDRLPGRSVSILWVPERVEDPGSWRYQLRGGSAERLFPDEPAGLDEHRIASRLLDSWLEHLYREVWRAA